LAKLLGSQDRQYFELFAKEPSSQSQAKAAPDLDGGQQG
jgi:hypothetical protein